MHIFNLLRSIAQYVFKFCDRCLFKLNNLVTVILPPDVFCHLTSFNRKILSQCSMLNEPYVPPFLWGCSGHIQTFIYGKFGRVRSPLPVGQRKAIIMPDLATNTFDVFEAHQAHPKGDFTLVISPGIANNSESKYIRSFVLHAQRNGFRVVVLNYLGTLKDQKLTSPRLFTYGGTDEYAAMFEDLLTSYSESTFIAVGFSMGGNILLKYLGDVPSRQSNFLCAITFCQAYSALELYPFMESWRGLRKAYNWAVTQNMLGILRRNYDELFGAEKSKARYDLGALFSSKSMLQIDQHFGCINAGYPSKEEYFMTESCIHNLHKIRLPLFLVASYDDPLVPPPLLTHAHRFWRECDNVIFAITHHGGHLGFYEDCFLGIRRLTWLDRFLLQYANAAIDTLRSEVNDPVKNDSSNSEVGQQVCGRKRCAANHKN